MYYVYPERIKHHKFFHSLKCEIILVNMDVPLKCLFLFAFCFSMCESGPVRIDPVYLDHGQTFNCTSPQDYGKLQIFCYVGRPKYIVHIWQCVSIYSKSENYLQYDGATPEEVQALYNEHKSSWSFDIFSWKQRYFKLNPFNQSCIGLKSYEPYSLYLNVIRIDYWKVLRLLTGILLFVSAAKLSKNSLFYYITGVTFGICASFLILIYFISKLFPRKPVMYGVVVFGWTVGVYILQMLWENLRVIFLTYQAYVMWYTLISGFISFVLCYRWGPVSNERTRNLIKWSLQAVGLGLVFSSSDFQEAAMGQVVILLLIYNLPKSWILKTKTYWKRKFPPKVKLLTNDEYYHQGVRETAKALQELKTFCSSPECNQWKTALKLKDVKSPDPKCNPDPVWTPPESKRFASFIEGSSHLSDDEILEYESSLAQLDLTDDESTDED